MEVLMFEPYVFLTQMDEGYAVMVRLSPFHSEKKFAPFDSFENAHLCANLYAARHNMQLREGVYVRQDNDQP